MRKWKSRNRTEVPTPQLQMLQNRRISVPICRSISCFNYIPKILIRCCWITVLGCSILADFRTYYGAGVATGAWQGFTRARDNRYYVNGHEPVVAARIEYSQRKSPNARVGCCHGGMIRRGQTHGEELQVVSKEATSEPDWLEDH